MLSQQPLDAKDKTLKIEHQGIFAPLCVGLPGMSKYSKNLEVIKKF